MILNTLIFILFLIFFLILPAKILFKLVNLDHVENRLIYLGILIGTGIINLTLCTIIIRLLNLNIRVLWVLPILSVIFLFRRETKISNEKVNDKFLHLLFPLLIILIGTVTQSLALFNGGSLSPQGMSFPAFHDTLWNVSIVAEIFHHFPPQHPGYAGALLKNDHYFYHIFLATASALTNISIIEIYYKLGPILVTFLFGLSLYIFASLFTRRPFFRGLSVFLGYFSGTFAYLAPFFLGRYFVWTHNIFLSDQPFDQIINPYTVLGFSLFLIGLYLFYNSQLYKKEFSWVLFSSLYFGTLYGYKSFGGILILVSLSVYSLFNYLISCQIRSFFVILLSGIIFLPIFLTLTNFGTASLNWAPGWILTALVADKDRLNLPYIASVESYYHSVHNYFGLFKIKFFEFIIYFIGNLGIRILGLILVIGLLVQVRKNYKDSNLYKFLFLIFLSSLFAFGIPLLFNLSLNAYDIMQFTPYALCILAVLTSIALEQVYIFSEKRKKVILGILIIIMVILLSIPGTVQTFLSGLNPPSQFVTSDEIQALNYLKKNSSPNDLILINPVYFKDPMFISALSERRFYLGDPGLVAHTGLNPATRQKEVTDFFTGKINYTFLKLHNTSYIFLPRKYDGNINLNSLKPFFSNTSIVIYKLAVS